RPRSRPSPRRDAESKPRRGWKPKSPKALGTRIGHEELSLSNGPRLSCGANAGGRKRPALLYELVGAQKHTSSENRPRQLQALVSSTPGHGATRDPIDA